MQNVDIITMGCSKNLVDSERLMKQFAVCGFRVHHNPQKTHGDIAVVNTCGFIGDAKEESINTILELCEEKSAGELRSVYVMGCLSERYRRELAEEIPEVDKFYGKFDWTNLLADLQATYRPQLCDSRVLTTPKHYAYVKISEGCNRKCAYCAIPIITGNHKSRPIEAIEAEVKSLVAEGVREFQLIAQELTFYGIDTYGEQRIAELVERLADIEGVEWLRLHYAYPTHFPLDLLRVIRERKNVCNYLDIALQHISDPILTRMQRHTSEEETLTLLETIRREVPGIALRTTLMVGFPGETDEDFEKLMDFVRTQKFDRMGAFAYSEEDDTYAARNYKDDVPEDLKRERLDKLMGLQEEISTRLNADKVGKTFRTIIDRHDGDYFIGRTEYDSPDVDCEVLIRDTDSELRPGNFYDVLITDADEFDLYGTVRKAAAE